MHHLFFQLTKWNALSLGLFRSSSKSPFLLPLPPFALARRYDGVFGCGGGGFFFGAFAVNLGMHCARRLPTSSEDCMPMAASATATARRLMLA